MSYILQALDKSNKEEQQSDKVSAEHHNSSPSVMPVITTTNNSIAWGVLLTLAIFLSLIIGFYLGQNSHLNLLSEGVNKPSAQIYPLDKNTLSTDSTAKNSIDTNAKVTEKPALLTKEGKPESLIELETVKSAPVIVKLSPPEHSYRNAKQTKPIAAESYFESPPSKKQRAQTNVANELSEQNATKTRQVNNKPVGAKSNALPEISDDLLREFQLAVEDTESGPEYSADTKKILSRLNQGVKPLEQMPQWVKNDLPRLDFDMHMYSSEDGGWVKVNGQKRRENQFIAQDVVLKKIAPQKVILMFKGEVFSLEALASW